MKHYDVIVIGVGAMGAAACFHAARKGARVLGLDQYGIPHDRGSSHGHSRMIRLAYYEHPDYVPLLRRAYELWDSLQDETGLPILHRTGGLYLGPHEGGLIRGFIQSASLHNLKHSLLSQRDLALEFPQFQIPESWVAFHEDAAGFLRPERAISVHAELALRSGAVIHGNEPVRSWKRDGESLEVSTDTGRYSADRLIFCGGAWTAKLVPNLAASLGVTRQVIGWVWPSNPELFALGRFPVWAIENPDGSLQYGFPMFEDNPGLKTAWHGKGQPTDPDLISRAAMAGDEQTFLPALARFLPEALGPVLSVRTCLYTNSPDHHFILDQLEDDERITIACGFSGHGFKFSSVIGEILSEMAIEGRSRHPVAFLKTARLKQKQSVLERTI